MQLCHWNWESSVILSAPVGHLHLLKVLAHLKRWKSAQKIHWNVCVVCVVLTAVSLPDVFNVCLRVFTGESYSQGSATWTAWWSSQTWRRSLSTSGCTWYQSLANDLNLTVWVVSIRKLLISQVLNYETGFIWYLINDKKRHNFRWKINYVLKKVIIWPEFLFFFFFNILHEKCCNFTLKSDDFIEIWKKKACIKNVLPHFMIKNSFFLNNKNIWEKNCNADKMYIVQCTCFYIEKKSVLIYNLD